MKQANSSFWEASLISGLSQLQLWILIQNKVIRSITLHQETKIDTYKLREWIISNNRIVYELRLRVDERDTHFSLKNCIKKYKKQKYRR